MNEIKMNTYSNRETLVESWTVYDENGDLRPVTGATIVFSATDPDTKEEVLSGTTGGGEIVISSAVITLTIPVGTMRDLEPKNYKVGCTVLLSGVTTQFFTGMLPIIDGVVP